MLMAMPTIPSSKDANPWHTQSAEPDEWCMIAVRPGKEPESCDSFRRRSVRCYWPNYCTFEARHFVARGRYGRRDNYRSILPGYLFSPFPLSSSFWDVVEMHAGVVGPIRTFSGDIMLLRNADIQVIRKIEAGQNTPEPGKSLHNFKTGQKVRFKDDAPGHWPPGRVARVVDDGRIVVDVELMGRIVPVFVLPHQIERM